MSAVAAFFLGNLEFRGQFYEIEFYNSIQNYCHLHVVVKCLKSAWYSAPSEWQVYTSSSKSDEIPNCLNLDLTFKRVDIKKSNKVLILGPFLLKFWFLVGTPTSICHFLISPFVCLSVHFSVVLHISGTVHHLIIIFGTRVQNDGISRCFFPFFYFDILGC